MPSRNKDWGTGVLTLRALNSKQRPCHVTPCEDKHSGKIYTGQGYMKEEAKANCALIVTELTRFTLKNGLRIDLKDEVDKIQWAWVQHHPYIAWTEEEAKASPDAIFFVENKVEKAKSSMDRERQIAKVKHLIFFQANLDAKRGAAKVLGITDPAISFPEEDLLNDFLVKKVNQPDRQGDEMAHCTTLLRLLDPTHAEETEALTQIEDLIKAGIIWRAKGGVWKYGSKTEGMTVGREKQNVLAFVLNQNNFDLVQEMLQQLEDAKE